MWATIALQSTVDTATAVLTQFLGLAVLAGAVAGASAVVYQWFVRERVPHVLAILAGLAAVAVYLVTGSPLEGTALSLRPTEEALLNMVALLFGAGGALAGRRAGDRFATDVVLEQSLTDVDEDVSQFVRAMGRVTVVELPEDVEDVVGYDPVPDATREALAGKRFVFPRSLTVPELRDRLVSRLKEDYAVGHVDLELSDDGTVEHVGVGSRAAGIGPTLPPATNAVALRADPAFSASAGDLVQVWETDPMRRVLTGELRGVADDVVTVAIDASDTPKVDPTREYRLVTLPVEDRPAREFASLLRSAAETFSSVTVEAGSPLHGMPVGALAIAVVAVKPDDAPANPQPDSTALLAPGDTLFAIARPEALRRLQTAAEPLDPALVRDVGRPAVGTDDASAGTETAAEETPSDEIVEDTDDGVAPADGVTADADDGVPASDDGDGTTEPSDGDEEVTVGKADSSSFDDLKEEFESGEADWSGEGEPTAETDEPTESTPETGESTESTPETADAGSESIASDDAGDASATPSSFSDLKEEFESGEADWADESGDETATGDGDSTGSAGDLDDPGDGLDGLDIEDGTDDADDSFEDIEGLDLADEGDDTGEGFGDDSLDGLDIDDGSGDDEADDLSELSFDEDEDDDLLEFDGDDDLFGDDDGFGDSLDEADEDGEEDDWENQDDGEGDDEDEDSKEDDDNDGEGDDEDGDDDGGGGTSFQQLKEEFESGEADWEDEISDSPGGDMRLDE